MNTTLTYLTATIMSGSALMLSPASLAEEKESIARALGKKISSEVAICIEGGSGQSHEFENQKHLKLMMPETYEKCAKGVKSACDVKSSVLLAMELANNKG